MSPDRKSSRLTNPYAAPSTEEELNPRDRLRSKAVMRLLAVGAGAAGLQLAGATGAHADEFGVSGISDLNLGGGDIPDSGAFSPDSDFGGDFKIDNEIEIPKIDVPNDLPKQEEPKQEEPKQETPPQPEAPKEQPPAQADQRPDDAGPAREGEFGLADRETTESVDEAVKGPLRGRAALDAIKQQQAQEQKPADQPQPQADQPAPQADQPPQAQAPQVEAPKEQAPQPQPQPQVEAPKEQAPQPQPQVEAPKEQAPQPQPQPEAPREQAPVPEVRPAQDVRVPEFKPEDLPAPVDQGRIGVTDEETTKSVDRAVGPLDGGPVPDQERNQPEAPQRAPGRSSADGEVLVATSDLSTIRGASATREDRSTEARNGESGEGRGGDRFGVTDERTTAAIDEAVGPRPGPAEGEAPRPGDQSNLLGQEAPRQGAAPVPQEAPGSEDRPQNGQFGVTDERTTAALGDAVAPQGSPPADQDRVDPTGPARPAPADRDRSPEGSASDLGEGLQVGLRSENGQLVLPGGDSSKRADEVSLDRRPQPTDTQGEYRTGDRSRNGATYYRTSSDGDRDAIVSRTVGEGDARLTAGLRVSDPDVRDSFTGEPDAGSGGGFVTGDFGPNLNREQGVAARVGFREDVPGMNQETRTRNLSAGVEAQIGDPDEDYPNFRGGVTLGNTRYPGVELGDGNDASGNSRTVSGEVRVTPNLSARYENVAQTGNNWGGDDSTDNRFSVNVEFPGRDRLDPDNPDPDDASRIADSADGDRSRPEGRTSSLDLDLTAEVPDSPFTDTGADERTEFRVSPSDAGTPERTESAPGTGGSAADLLDSRRGDDVLVASTRTDSLLVGQDRAPGGENQAPDRGTPLGRAVDSLAQRPAEPAAARDGSAPSPDEEFGLARNSAVDEVINRSLPDTLGPDDAPGGGETVIADPARAFDPDPQSSGPGSPVDQDRTRIGVTGSDLRFPVGDNPVDLPTSVDADGTAEPDGRAGTSRPSGADRAPAGEPDPAVDTRAEPDVRTDADATYRVTDSDVRVGTSAPRGTSPDLLDRTLRGETTFGTTQLPDRLFTDSAADGRSRLFTPDATDQRRNDPAADRPTVGTGGGEGLLYASRGSTAGAGSPEQRAEQARVLGRNGDTRPTSTLIRALGEQTPLAPGGAADDGGTDRRSSTLAQAPRSSGDQEPDEGSSTRLPVPSVPVPAGRGSLPPTPPADAPGRQQDDGDPRSLDKIIEDASSRVKKAPPAAMWWRRTGVGLGNEERIYGYLNRDYNGLLDATDANSVTKLVNEVRKNGLDLSEDYTVQALDQAGRNAARTGEAAQRGFELGETTADYNTRRNINNSYDQADRNDRNTYDQAVGNRRAAVDRTVEATSEGPSRLQYERWLEGLTPGFNEVPDEELTPRQAEDKKAFVESQVQRSQATPQVRVNRSLQENHADTFRSPRRLGSEIVVGRPSGRIDLFDPESANTRLQEGAPSPSDQLASRLDPIPRPSRTAPPFDTADAREDMDDAAASLRQTPGAERQTALRPPDSPAAPDRPDLRTPAETRRDGDEWWRTYGAIAATTDAVKTRTLPLNPFITEFFTDPPEARANAEYDAQVRKVRNDYVPWQYRLQRDAQDLRRAGYNLNVEGLEVARNQQQLGLDANASTSQAGIDQIVRNSQAASTGAVDRSETGIELNNRRAQQSRQYGNAVTESARDDAETLSDETNGAVGAEASRRNAALLLPSLPDDQRAALQEVFDESTQPFRHDADGRRVVNPTYGAPASYTNRRLKQVVRDTPEAYRRLMSTPPPRGDTGQAAIVDPDAEPTRPVTESEFQAMPLDQQIEYMREHRTGRGVEVRTLPDSPEAGAGNGS